MSVRLYVGNLPKEPIERQALQEVFGEAEESSVVSTKVIKDRKTGKCRGFAFVTVASEEEADKFIEEYNGKPFMETSLRIERAQPRTKTKSEEEGEGAIGTEAPTPKENRKKSGSGGKKPKNRSATPSNKQPESIQPDPRWADQLAQLKEMLAAANN